MSSELESYVNFFLLTMILFLPVSDRKSTRTLQLSEHDDHLYSNQCNHDNVDDDDNIMKDNEDDLSVKWGDGINSAKLPPS